MDKLLRVMIGYSFGLRKDGFPTKSNSALAMWANTVNEMLAPDITILQTEIAECVNFNPSLIIKNHKRKNEYLDAEEVTVQAVDFLKELINQNEEYSLYVYIIAHQWLHWSKCMREVKKCLKKSEIKGNVIFIRGCIIPFDAKSDQWYTRGHIRALLYAILQLMGKKTVN